MNVDIKGTGCIMDRALETLQLFGSLTVSLLVLFIPISIGIVLVQRALGVDRLQRWLGGANLPLALAKGTALGAVTPFCGCSTVPLLLGLLQARVRFAAVAAFMLASPLLNPYILGVVALLFGVRAAVVYASFAVVACVVAATIWERLGLERHLVARGSDPGERQPAHAAARAVTTGPDVARVPSGTGAPVARSNGEVAPAQDTSACSASAASSCGDDGPQQGEATCSTGAGSSCGDPASTAWRGIRVELRAALGEAAGMLRPMIKPLLAGMAVGALIYGAAPEGLLAAVLGHSTWWTLPLAAVLGLPLYLRGEAAFPIGAGLMAAGVGAGPMLAMVIGGMGASLPELTLLSALFDRVLLTVFVATVLAMAILGGAIIPLLW
jgi:uncharacterized protein